MRQHWKGILGIFLVTAVLFATGVVTQSMYLSVVSIVSGLVIAFVMAIAWSRPTGSPKERHAAHDSLMNDTRP